MVTDSMVVAMVNIADWRFVTGAEVRRARRSARCDGKVLSITHNFSFEMF